MRERTAELQAANKALSESEARLRLALDASNAGTWSWDPATNASDWDDRYHEMYGLDPRVPRSFETWITRVHPEDRQGLLAAIQNLQQPGADSSWDQEFRVLHPVKGERWMAGLGRIERDGAGRALRFSGINLDITDRKRSEVAMRSQLDYIETIYQTAPVGLCALDADLRYLRINERLATMNGKPVAEHIGRTVREMVPHLADGTETICRQVIATGQPVLNLELEGTTDAQPGARRAWVTHWVPFKQADGRATGISVLVEEITERKRMEQALRESEAKYRRLHESMTDAFVAVDLSGRIIEFNPAYQAMLGYTADELGQLTYVDLTPAEWHEFEARIVAEQILPRGYSEVYEKEYRRKDGTVFPVELRTYLLRDAKDQPARMWAIVRDITRRKQAEAALRQAHDTLEARVKERTAALAESEERYRSLVNNLNVGVYRSIPGAQGCFVHANLALARMHGCDSVEEFQKVRVADLYQDPRDRADFLAALQRQGTLRDYELRLKKKDGTPIYASVNATAHRGLDGEVDWIDGMIEDITQRKLAEDALRTSEERYRTLAESSPDAIFILDRDIRVQYVNSTAAALWRRQPQDLIGLTQAELFPAETAQRQSRVVRSVFETGEPVHRDKPLAFPVGEQWIEIRLAPLRDAQGTVTSVMGICRDITERKRAEQQLAEALDLNQKMIAASTMGIAAFKASGECVFANEALARIAGGSLSELEQDNFYRLEFWRESGLLQQAEEALRQRQARSGEIFGTTRFGKVVSLDCHLAPFVSNGQPHLLVMALDITDRKRAESLLQAQRDVGVSLSLTSDMTVALRRFLEIAVQIGGLDCGGVYLLNPVTQELELAAHRGLSDSFVKSVAYYSADSPEMRLVQQGRSVFDNFQNLPVHHSATALREGLRAIAVIPLSHNRRIIGLLNMASHTAEEIPPQAQIVVETIAAQAAGAIARISAEAERHRLERQLLEISDREHARIGQDIHDGLCQQLVSLALDANTLRGQLTAARRPEAKTARRIADYLDQAITEARQLSRGLFPVRLAREGLPPALEELAAVTRDRFKIRCRFTSEGPVAVESSVMATHLYRIAQEAVNNAIKHSQARSIAIRLRARAGNARTERYGQRSGPLRTRRRKHATGHGPAYHGLPRPNHRGHAPDPPRPAARHGGFLLRPRAHKWRIERMRRKARAVGIPRKRARILLVDDHPLVRERLAEIINREADLIISGEAEDRPGGPRRHPRQAS